MTAILTFPDGGWRVGGWLDELELKQALRFSFGLGLCNINECSTQRFIHTKEAVPKYFEGVVDKSKDRINSGH
jgi:hypothetical protein